MKNTDQKTLLNSNLVFGTEPIKYDTSNKTSHPEFKSYANNNQKDASYELRSKLIK